MNIVVYGDSNSVGYGVSPSERFVDRIKASLQPSSLEEVTANGDQAGDASFKSYGRASLGPLSCIIIAIGTNDQWRYGASAQKLDYFGKAYRSIVVSRIAANKKTARQGGIVFTGQWSDTVVNAIGKNASVSGASATCTVSGESIYIGSIYQDSAAANSIARVFIDDVEVGEIGCYAPGITTHNGMSYPPVVHRYGGLSAGSHSVRISVVSSGKYFYLDYISGSDDLCEARILAVTVPPMSAAAYSSLGGSLANTDSYNVRLSDIIAELVSDGATGEVLNPGVNVSDLQADGVHLNPSGHTKYASSIITAIEASFTYTPTQILRRSDGRLFVDDAFGRTEIKTS